MYYVYELDVTGTSGFNRHVLNQDDTGVTFDEAAAYIASHKPDVPANFFFLSTDKVPSGTMQRLAVT